MIEIESEPPPTYYINDISYNNDISMTMKCGVAKITSEITILKAATVLLDTGADINVAGQACIQRIGLTDEIRQYSKGERPNIRLAGTEKTIIPIGYLNVLVILEACGFFSPANERTAKIRVHVLESTRDLIIGIRSMMEQIPMFVIELLKHYAKAVQLPEQELAAISDRWVMPQAKMFDKEQYDIVHKDAEVGKIYLPWLNKSKTASEDGFIDAQEIPGLPDINEMKQEHEKEKSEFNIHLDEAIKTIVDDESEKRLWIKLLAKTYRQCFVFDTWTGIDIKPIHIDTLMSMPINHQMPCRNIPYENRAKVQQMVKLYVEEGFYIKGSSPTVSGMVTVMKPDGSPRICSDFRWLNKHLRGFNSFLPDIRQSLEAMAGFTIFAELDWLKAYRQFPIDEETGLLLAMITPYGVIKPRFLPEGVATATSIMQHHVQNFYAHLSDFTIMIADNILVGGKNISDLRLNVGEVLEVALQRNIILSMKKSNFGLKNIQFFGYQLREGSYEIDEGKRKAVSDIQCPRTWKTMKSFIGLAGFFSPFICKYSDKAAQLHKASSKTFDWKDKETVRIVDEVVEEMKKAMINSTEIYFPDRRFPWVLRTDASLLGIGGVLLQVIPRHVAKEKGLIPKEGEDSIMQPIWFGSMKFSTQAATWSTIEQETFSIVYCLKKLQYYLSQRPFILETDHANILYLEKSDVPKLVRWRLYLQEFDFLLRHIPGFRNLVADFYSRHRMEIVAIEAEEENLQEGEDMLKIFDISTLQLFANHTEDEVESQMDEERHINDIEREEYDSSESEEDSDNEKEEHEIRPHRNPLQQDQQETILMNQDQMFKMVHNGKRRHKGVQRTYLDIRARFPEAQFSVREVRDQIDDCAWCQKHRLAKRRKMQEVRKSLHLNHVRHTICMDTLTLKRDSFGYKYLLVLINHATKRVHLVPGKNRSAETTRAALLDFIKNNGFFQTWWSDPGSEFDNELVDQLNVILGMDMGFTLVNRPEANGVERTNGTILEYLQILAEEEGIADKWSDISTIATLQLMLNENINDETGYSPNELTYGMEDKRYGAFPNVPYKGDDTWLRDFSKDISKLRAKAKELQEKRQGNRKKGYEDSNFRYQKGDFVFIRNDNQLQTHKFVPKNRGPYQVITHEQNNVLLRNLVTKKDKIYHSSKCLIFTGTEEEALRMARGEAQEQVITRIVTHKGNPVTPSNNTFQIEWDDRTLTWEPYENIKDTEALTVYGQLRNHTIIYTLGPKEWREWKTTNNRIKVANWNHTRHPQIPTKKDADIIISVHYFNKRDTLQTENIPDWNNTNRVLAGFIESIEGERKSIDIRIPTLDYKHKTCILQLRYTDCIQYLQVKLNRREGDQEVIQKRDLEKTILKQARILETVYGEDYK